MLIMLKLSELNILNYVFKTIAYSINVKEQGLKDLNALQRHNDFTGRANLHGKIDPENLSIFIEWCRSSCPEKMSDILIRQPSPLEIFYFGRNITISYFFVLEKKI